MRSALRHAGPARVLVHRLKYEGVREAAGLLAEMMAGHLDVSPAVLVPVRRVAVRAWRYGIDPGRELARALAALLGWSMADLLRPPLWAPARAGGDRRSHPRYSRRDAPCHPVVLVDDVLTTGATLEAARAAIGPVVAYGVTATAAGRVEA